MTIILRGKTPKRNETDRRTYLLDVQVKGRRVRLSTGTRDRVTALRKEQAVVDALQDDMSIPKDVLKALVTGRATSAQEAIQAKRDSRTLAEAFSEALNDRNFWRDRLSVKTIRGNCKTVLDCIGKAQPLNSITQKTVDTLVDRLEAKGYSPATINRKMHCLTSVLRREAKAGRYTERIPEYKPASERDNARQFVLSLGDEAMILQRVLQWDEEPDSQTLGRLRKRDGHHYHDLFVFLADIGCRLSQAISVRWSDIERRPDGMVVVRFWRAGEQKGGMVRTIPCSARVVEVLERRNASHTAQSGPFIMLDKCRANKIWHYALKGTHLEKERECVIHSLRHTCATRMLQVTGDIKLVQEWVGHRDIKTTASVYAKVLIGQKIDALKGLEAYRRNGQHSL